MDNDENEVFLDREGDERRTLKFNVNPDPEPLPFINISSRNNAGEKYIPIHVFRFRVLKIFYDALDGYQMNKNLGLIHLGYIRKIWSLLLPKHMT